MATYMAGSKVARGVVKGDRARVAAHLEQDFDEDTGGGGGVVLGEAHGVNDLPGDGVRGQQVPKEARNVAQLVGFQPVDQRILPAEAVLEAGLVLALQHAETLRQQPVVPASAMCVLSEHGHDA